MRIFLALAIAVLASLSVEPTAQASAAAPATGPVATGSSDVRYTTSADRFGNRRLARSSSRALRVRARSRRRRSPKQEAPAPATTPSPTPTQAAAPEPAPAPAPTPAPTSELAPTPPPAPAPTPLLEAGFENGLAGWNVAGVGDAVPSVAGDIVRSGSKSAKVILTGAQNRSELILGGNGGGSVDQMVKFPEGAEYWYGFSFYIKSMIYGKPGAHNLIMQLKGNDNGSPAFGLQLWDYVGDSGQYRANPKGLWSHGTGMGGDRFLAPVAEQQWHDVAIHIKASRVGAGFYEVYLDGKQVDARNNTSTLPPEATFAYIKNGLYRNGSKLVGTSEIRLDSARLGTSQASVSG